MLLSSSQAGRAAVRASQKRVAPTVAPMGSAAFAATRHSARTVATEIAAGSQTLRPSRPPPALVSKRVGKGRLHLSAQHLRASPLESLTQQGQRGDGGDEHVVGGLQRTSTTAAQSADDGPVVAIDDTHSKINITWSSGTESRYHNLWLRDHCRCPKCYHPQTKQRQLDTFSIAPDLKPLGVEATAEGLLVFWPRSQIDDGGAAASSSDSSVEPAGDTSHPALYPWSWLHANSYAPVLSHGSTGPMAESNLILWGSGIAQQPPKISWEEVMSEHDERGVARWLSKLAQFGFCFVTGVPPTPEDTQRLVEKIAFIRETHYGGFWDFTSDLSHGDTAYTNLPLGAHTDTTYFTDPAGLQMFHLLSHIESQKGSERTPAAGGESLLVDGFFAAKILREVHPEAYRVLSTVPVTTHSAGDDDTLIQPLQRAGYPILEHDHHTGALIRVRYNNDDRSVLQISDEDVLPFYDALGKWHRVISHSDSEYWSQLTPGNALIFDNHRVLHGRSAFTGQRRLCGAYVNHDDYRSRVAILVKRYPDVTGGVRTMSKSPVGATRRSEAAGEAGQGVASEGSSAPSQSHTHRRGVWDDGL